MRNVHGMFFCLGMFAAGCALDSADAPTEEQAVAGALAATGCNNGQDCATSAAFDDSFQVWTDDHCGRADFVDFGPGAPGGGDNDDYIVIHDFCQDGHGVKAWAWINGVSVNNDKGAYNGNGLAGDPVIWDPFKQADDSDVHARDHLGIKVCVVDGANASSGPSCGQDTKTSQDG